MDSNEIFFKYTTSVEKLIVRIERSIKIQNCFEYDKETSRTIYINVSDTLHDLKVLIASMEIILEDEKKKLKQSQNKLSHLKLLNKQIDSMMIFSLQNSVAIKDDSCQSLPSIESKPLSNEDGNKENFPERIKVLEKKKVTIPSINILSTNTFNKVPKYVKGRLTLQQVNSGIADINLVLSKKYQLLNRPRKCLSLKEERLRALYIEQAKDLKGTCYSTFFVDDDIQKYSASLKLQKKSKDSIFLILRHLGKMKEVHKGKLNRYCILTV